MAWQTRTRTNSPTVVHRQYLTKMHGKREGLNTQELMTKQGTPVHKQTNDNTTHETREAHDMIIWGQGNYMTWEHMANQENMKHNNDYLQNRIHETINMKQNPTPSVTLPKKNVTQRHKETTSESKNWENTSLARTTKGIPIQRHQQQMQVTPLTRTGAMI